MKTMIFIFSSVLLLVTGNLFSQNLTLRVEGFEKVGGKLYVAIFNSQESFRKKPCAAFAVDVKDKTVIVPCKGLPIGTYAISMYQDENNNGKLDTAAFGIPTEKYGFSNDAKGVMGPPSYEKCSFSFSKDMTLTIHLN